MTQKQVMGIREMEMRARIVGGSSVLMAIDRLATPMPGKSSAERMKAGMQDLQKWTMTFHPDMREPALIAVGRHVKQAIEQMKNQSTVKAE